MVKKDKLIEKLKNSPNNVKFSDIRKLLELEEFFLDRINRRSVIMNYPIVVYPCEEGGFVAEIPALKGCLAQGETLEETLQELIIVRNLWLETAEKYGQKLPDIEGAIAKVKALSSV